MINISLTAKALQMVSTIFIGSMLMLSACEVEKPDRYLEEGKALFNSGDLDGARLQYRNALQLDPKLAEAYFGLALIEERQHNWLEMADKLLATVAADPAHLPGQIRLGRLYLLSGQLDKADRQAKIAVQLDSHSLDAALLAAEIEFGRGNTAGLLNRVEELLEKRPNLAGAVGLKARMLAAGGKYDEALALLAAGIEQNPGMRDLWLLKIRLEIDDHRFEQAVHDYEAVIAQTPEADLYGAYADLLNQIGRRHDAESVLKQAVDRMPGNDALKFRLADYYLANRRLQEAESVLRKIADDAAGPSEQALARIKLAQSALLQHNRVRVLQLAEEVLALDAANVEALLLRAGMRLDKGDAEGAVADLRIVLRERPESEQAL
ncbi:MAG: tetratricopeptide repeat protein, partial [Methylomonas sp.]|nr:tetratricopeptide repeat protein [Methylomonas sp.]